MKNNNKNNSTKESIKVPIFYFDDGKSEQTLEEENIVINDDGQIYDPTNIRGDKQRKVYDFEAMADEFENQLSKLDPNVVIMCSVENKNEGI
tara:strand:+ start:192 stop:467 length:276 start_codon:yes stop_codon:yes gene_type:complete